MDDAEEKDKTERRASMPRCCSSSISSIYQSTHSNLNKGSQQTLYHDVRNTMHEDTASMNSFIRDLEEAIVNTTCEDTRPTNDNIDEANSVNIITMKF